MSFWDIIWFIIVSFFFISYLMLLFNIIADVFRDPDLSGGMKAVWMVALIFVPLLTALVYLIVRGPSMARRQAQAVETARDSQTAYIKSLAGSSPAEDIAKGKELLDSGGITQAEFEALKTKALS